MTHTSEPHTESALMTMIPCGNCNLEYVRYVVGAPVRNSLLPTTIILLGKCGGCSALTAIRYSADSETTPTGSGERPTT